MRSIAFALLLLATPAFAFGPDDLATRLESELHRGDRDARRQLETLKTWDPHHPSIPVLERRLLRPRPALPAVSVAPDAAPVGRRPPPRLRRPAPVELPDELPEVPAIILQPPPADLPLGIGYRVALIEGGLEAGERALAQEEPAAARQALEAAAADLAAMERLYGARVPDDAPSMQALRARLEALFRSME